MGKMCKVQDINSETQLTKKLFWCKYFLDIKKIVLVLKEYNYSVINF